MAQHIANDGDFKGVDAIIQETGYPIMNDAETLAEAIDDWREDEDASPVALAVGYSDDAFAEAVILGRPNRYALLCDKAYADRATLLANELLKNPPRMRISSRFRSDLLGVQRVGSDRILAVPFRQVASYLLAETQRMRRRTEMIFGDPDREDRIAPKVVVALRQLVDALARYSATDVLFCDPGGDCLRHRATPAAVLVPEGFDLDEAGDFAAARVEPPEWGPEEEARLFARAAYFVEQSGEQLRPLLHPKEEDTVLRALVQDWFEEMMRLGDLTEDDEKRDMAARAAAKLSREFEDL